MQAASRLNNQSKSGKAVTVRVLWGWDGAEGRTLLFFLWSFSNSFLQQPDQWVVTNRKEDSTHLGYFQVLFPPFA